MVLRLNTFVNLPNSKIIKHDVLARVFHHYQFQTYVSSLISIQRVTIKDKVVWWY